MLRWKGSGIMYYAWNPWHGCRKLSPGCKNCFVQFLDQKRGNEAKGFYKVKTKFNYPVQKTRNGEYKIPSGVQVGTCFTSDFFIEEADEFRPAAWKMIAERPDVEFLIPTKRIARFLDCIPKDWEEGYPNVFICVSIENQRLAEERIPILQALPIQKKGLFLAPLLEEIHLEKFLEKKDIAYVSVGGESYANARPCRFEWVESIKKQCEAYGVPFDFHQTGSNFIKDGKAYRIPHHLEYEQAKKAFLKK